MHPLLVRKTRVCCLNKKATREKYIYQFIYDFQSYVGEGHERTKDTDNFLVTVGDGPVK
jgi:hypothetical protein